MKLPAESSQDRHASLPKLVTVAAVAEAFSLSESFVRLLIRQQRIPSLHVGRSVRVPLDGLEALVERALAREKDRP